jgi:WD40 repeat protein
MKHFSPNGRFFAFEDERAGSVHLWDTESGREHLHLDSVSGEFAFSSDSKHLANQSYGRIKLWELPSGKEKLVRGQPGEGVRSSPDGNSLAITSGVSPDDATPEFLTRLFTGPGHIKRPGRPATLTDETRIFSLTTGRLQAVCEGGSWGQFAPTGTLFTGMSSDGTTINLYDTSHQPRSGLIAAACILGGLLVLLALGFFLRYGYRRRNHLQLLELSKVI